MGLYQRRDAWLVKLHAGLDRHVNVAYGWPADLSDDDVLDRFIELNRERSSRGPYADPRE